MRSGVCYTSKPMSEARVHADLHAPVASGDAPAHGFAFSYDDAAWRFS